MTDISIADNDRFIQYLSAGSETAFDYDFPIFASTDLVVMLTTAAGVISTLSEGTDYTVTGVGVEAGGTVVPVVTPTSGDLWTIYGDTAEKRTTDFTTAGDFLAATLNKELDLIVQMLQQNERNITRSLRMTITDTGDIAGMELPEKADRAGKYIAFDASGNASASAGTGNDTALRTDLAASDGSSLIGFIQSGTNAASRTAQDKGREFPSIQDDGATGDGVSDDTTVINNSFADQTTPVGKRTFPPLS